MDMKSITILSLVLFPTLLFALPCPDGRGILYKGDSIESVLKQCGEPLTKKTQTRTLFTSQQWIYYRGHQFDDGYSQLVITFINDKVSAIRINDYYNNWFYYCRKFPIQIGVLTTIETTCGNSSYSASYTNLCRLGFGIGESSQIVYSVCGQPASQTNLQSHTEQTTELIYGGASQQTIVFENGKLVDWK